MTIQLLQLYKTNKSSKTPQGPSKLFKKKIEKNKMRAPSPSQGPPQNLQNKILTSKRAPRPCMATQNLKQKKIFLKNRRRAATPPKLKKKFEKKTNIP